MRMDQILAKLGTLEPRTPAARELHRAADRKLMSALVAGGIRAAERLVAALNAKGHRFDLSDKASGRRKWQELLQNGERAFEIRAVANRFYRVAAVRYVAIRKIELTPRQRRLQALQQHFYERYMAIGRKAYRDPPGKLTPMERRLLLVGELEADVNNGGFSQYLSNKGARRARAAVTALKAIGARKTAAMLAKAMVPGVTDAQLAALDGAFYKAPEDLAALAARHAGLTSSKAQGER